MKTQNDLIYKTILIYILFSMILWKSVESKNILNIVLVSIWILLHIVIDLKYFKNKR